MPLTKATPNVLSPISTSNTPDSIVLRDASGNFSAGTITANLAGNATTATTATTASNTTGNAATASALQTARTISLTGSVTGSASFDGSSDISITTSGGGGTGVSTNTPNTLVLRDGSGNFAAGTITASLSGNASSATTLQTARNINGVSFNGSSNIEINSFSSGINFEVNNTSYEDCYIGFVGAAGGAFQVGTQCGVGFQSTYCGPAAGKADTSGARNAAFGYAALFGANSTDNTAIGHMAGISISSGSLNTAVGKSALGSGSIGAVTNCTGLGANATVTGSNQVQLGDSTTTTYAYGAVQNRSDVRDKADIRDTQLGLEFISSLRPVDFKWDMREDYRPDPLPENATEEERAAYLESVKLANITHDGSKKRNRYHHGLIAQEVKAVLDAKGIDFGGYQDHSIKGGQDVLSIGYEELIAPMIKAIQELSAEVSSLKAQLNS